MIVAILLYFVGVLAVGIVFALAAFNSLRFRFKGDQVPAILAATAITGGILLLIPFILLPYGAVEGTTQPALELR